MRLIALALLALLVGCGEKDEARDERPAGQFEVVRWAVGDVPKPGVGFESGHAFYISDLDSVLRPPHDPALEYVLRVDTVGWVKAVDTVGWRPYERDTVIHGQQYVVFTYAATLGKPYWRPVLDTIWGKRIERRHTPDELRRLDELLKGEK